MAWKPPKDDGGAELSGYRIEYQELGAHDWERVPEQCTLLSYTVRNLEKGKQYRFRVFAENMAGISEPLNGDPVTAKDPFGWLKWNLMINAETYFSNTENTENIRFRNLC